MTVAEEVLVATVQTIVKITTTIYLTSRESTFHHLIRAATILVFTQTFYALLLLMASHIPLISIQEG